MVTRNKALHWWVRMVGGCFQRYTSEMYGTSVFYYGWLWNYRPFRWFHRPKPPKAKNSGPRFFEPFDPGFPEIRK